jgi:hypothetical protein
MSLLVCSNSTSSSVMCRPIATRSRATKSVGPCTAGADAGPAQADHGAELLATLELTDPGFAPPVLSEFRTRLVAGQAAQLLRETLLARVCSAAAA